MKYLLMTLTIIFSTSGLVNAETFNSRWIMLLTTAYYDAGIEPQGMAHQWTKKTYRNSSECYEDLKTDALYQNKENPNFEDESKFKIEVFDWGYKAVSDDGHILFELHCIEVTLD